jgi:hypothetical protein
MTFSTATDRELLKLAAKAANININGWDESGFVIGYWDGYELDWNPLEDDGDAFRLAVTLGLEIYVDDGTETIVSKDLRHDWHGGVTEPHGRNKYEATRRAIVRAAAEIGRAKQPD